MIRAAIFSSAIVFVAASLHAQGDSKFVKEASEGGMAEVELGQLAQQKAQSQAVRDFATRMLIDHSKTNDKLKGIASEENMPVSTSLSVSDKALKLKLEALSGATFDRAYMAAMVKDHRADVAAFQREANSGMDGKVKAFASETLPTLQDHLSMAEETASAVGVKW